MKKRHPNADSALTNNMTPDESLPDHQKNRPVSHNRETEKPKGKKEK